MRKSTSRVTPPSRKAEPAPAIPDEYLPPRWSDDDLHRVLALSTLGVLVFGGAWLAWRSTWLLWPAGLSALALQLSATMIAARAAVESRGRSADAASGAARRPARRPSGESLLAILARLVPPDRAEGAAAEEAAAPAEPPTIALPTTLTAPHENALHQAFFRRVVEAEFAEHAPGLAWPDLGTLQGSLATRLRLFQRHAATAPVPARDVSEADRVPHSPWHHLATLEGSDYRRDDTLARFSHRAFAPLAFLELHARFDVESDAREALEAELGRQYTVGYGRILTPPSVLSAVEPLRTRVGGAEAIVLADEARLAMRSSSNMREAERVRSEWLARARVVREQVGWPDEVISMVECLIDYWLVQRAGAADIEWAEELARLEETSLGAALARRDASDTFHFAEAIQLVSGNAGRVAVPAAPQLDAPTAAATVA